MDISGGIRDLFSYRKPFKKDVAKVADAADENVNTSREGVFFTKETLFTFAGASAVITVLLKLAQAAIPDSVFLKSVSATIVFALVYGVIQFIAEFADPENKNRTPYAFFMKAIIGLFNSAMVASSILGINATLGGS